MTPARIIGIASLIAAAVAVYSGMYQLEHRHPELAIAYLSELVGLTCGVIAIIQSRDDDGRLDPAALALGIVGCALAAVLASLTFLAHAFGSLAYV